MSLMQSIDRYTELNLETQCIFLAVQVGKGESAPPNFMAWRMQGDQMCNLAKEDKAPQIVGHPGKLQGVTKTKNVCHVKV